MDFVLGRIKRLRTAPYMKVLSDTSLFPVVSISDVTLIDYNGDHKLDDDSWFRIGEFSKSKYFLDLLRNDVDSKSFNNITGKHFASLSWIVAKQGHDFYFQKVSPAQFLSKKTLFSIGDVVKVEEGKRLMINSMADAIYVKSNDCILFKNLASISPIFPDIGQLHVEATLEEVTQFMSLGFLTTGEGYSADKVSKPNRRRIGLVLDSLNSLPDGSRADMMKYISRYCKSLQLSEDGGSFVIDNDQQLKQLLYSLDQRYYTTEMGGEDRLANSIQKL